MKGNWEGYYKFDNKNIQASIGFEKTNFKIEISKFDGINFYGKVNDDVYTGGMKETGDIIGKVNKDKISFRKLMPKNDVVFPDGEREVYDRKHPVLYYIGVFSDDKKEINGKWFFKRKLYFIYGIFPMFFRPRKGTWSMKLSNSN
ncbi:MAG: hypothetical protein EOO44_10670 [Flavobacterium sp.]|nr:MAG: hypothetical protein EOO44_10670 [Flavobacterium sp.]